jgi:ADP-ribose pyrophosphatase YjhB (NUDIX family)
MVVIDDSWYTRPAGVRASTSCGGIVVRIQDGKAYIALVREGEYSKYILPKGQLEHEEDLETAARREIEEEAGLTDLQRVAYLGALRRLNVNKRRWVTVHYYLFRTNQVIAEPTATNHNYTCDWFPVDELPEFFWPEQRQLILDTLPLIQGLLPSKA